MKLTFDEIKTIVKGAVRVEEKNDGFHFYRFTWEQEELYRETSADFHKKTFATSCVRLEFITDSPTLSVEVQVNSGASRKYFSHDITVDAKLISSFGSNATVKGIFAHTCELGEGTKTVCIYFPWSVISVLRNIELADGSTLAPVEKKYKMLMYGDSITQGYDAALTSQTYANRLTDLLNAETINRGIGGERFFPALAELSENVNPDIVTVAYGTNDWNKTESYEVFEQKCADFYGTLSRLYPKAKIFAITPIWRKDGERTTAVGTFDLVSKTIKRVTVSLPNVTVLEGYDFVPHDLAFFYDLRLHPNDEGFAHYAENLYTEIKKHF